MTDDVRALARHYSEAADAYERTWAGALHPVSRKLMTRLPLAGARRVLDVGAGVGTLLPALREAAPDALVAGIDRSPGMIAKAPAGFPRVITDATRLPFGDRTFDVAVAAFMLFHLPEPAAGLREARRVLADGGVLGLATWGPDQPMTAVEVWLEELDRHGAPQELSLLANHEAIDSPEKVAELVTAAGFADADMRAVDWEFRPTLEEFVVRYTGLGLPARRYAALPEAARAEFLASARARLARLGPEDFVHRRTIVTGVATARHSAD